MTPILNPEPGRFICRGLGARVNADVLAGFERDRGLKAVVLDANHIVVQAMVRGTIISNRQVGIAAADVIIDVIP